MKYAIPIVIVVLALLAASSIYVVGEGHAAVVTRPGSVGATHVAPGLHFKLPFVEQVKVYDTRTIVNQSEPEDYKTSGGDPVRVGFFVRWRVADSNTWFKATAGDELQVTQQLAPWVQAALRARIGEHSLAELLATDGGAIDSGLRAAVSSDARSKLGVEILDIGVERVLPPDGVLESVYKRMRAVAEATAAQIREKGQAEAAAIRATGDSADQQAIAAAAEHAAAVRGAGDAAAAKVRAQAAVTDPEFFRYWSSIETWRKTFGDGGAVVVLDSTSPFLQAIQQGASPTGKH